MPPGVQPGSGTKLPHSPFGPGCPALLPMVRGMGSRVPCRLGCNRDPAPKQSHSTFDSGFPALLSIVRGMGPHAAWGATGIRHQNLPTRHLTQGSRLCYPWFEAWGPGSHAAWCATGIRHQTSPLPIWPRVPGSATHGSKNGVPCRLGCNRDPARSFPTPQLAQGARLCYIIRGMGPMPPGVQQGSGTETPRSPFGPGFPALLSMVRGTGGFG